jgi:PAS domain S-box-containing protein
MCALKVSDNGDRDKCAGDVRGSQELEGYISCLAEIIENFPWPFAIHRLDWTLLNCNRAFSGLTGYTKDELYGMGDLSALTPIYYRDLDALAINTLNTGGTPRKYEKEIIRQAGTRLTVEVFPGCVRDKDGKPKLYYFFMSDMSGSIRIAEDIRRLTGEIDRERMLAADCEKKLEEQSLETSVILNALTEAVTIHDANCITLRTNAAAKACYGFDPCGMDIDTLNRKVFFRYPDGRRVSSEECPQLLAVHGDKVPARHYLITGAGGQDVAILMSAVPLYSDGQVTGAVCTWRDVTEHERLIKQIDNDRNLLHESLMQTDLYFDLMSHDIININQIGIGYMELALENLEKDDELSKLLMKSYESFKSSSKLIDNLSKIKRAKEVRTEVVDLGKLLADIKYKFPVWGGRDIIINYSPQDNCFVMANDLLRDVFMNILGNSAKHSEGPLSIDIALARAFENGRTYYKVSVEDNGPGIPDELKGKIFIRFHRDMTKARSRGIGLYLARSLLDGFDGRIWVEDRVPGDFSKGSRFVVMLPALKR